MNAIKICSTYSQGLFLLKDNSQQLQETKMDYCLKIIPHFFNKMVIPFSESGDDITKALRPSKVETVFANNKETIFMDLRNELHTLLT
mmetsp:Transcript_6171/g.9964  ORF Transcript_6171/g.9964 Transcript_6171/m.9964 type:complete len:88 (+) Transcript_6171:1783-2046(+)